MIHSKMKERTKIYCYVLWVFLLLLLQSGISEGMLDISETRNISCTASINTFDLAGKSVKFGVICPSNCLNGYTYVAGTSYYSTSSSICVAGIHAGVITNAGGWMKVTTHFGWRTPYGSVQNGVSSNDGYEDSTTFTLEGQLSTAATTTAAKAIEKAEEITTTTSTPTTAAVTTLPAPHHPSSVKQSILSTHLASFKSLATSVPVEERSVVPSVNHHSNETLHSSERKSQLSTTIQYEETTTVTDFVISIKETGAWSSNYLWGAIVVLAVTIILVGAWKYHKKRQRRPTPCCSKHRGTRGADKGGVESCVCYIAVDSSVQALLADPETCERPCILRERLQEESRDTCGVYANEQCDGCSGEKCASQYDF